jgi:hypothetical protein
MVVRKVSEIIKEHPIDYSSIDHRTNLKKITMDYSSIDYSSEEREILENDDSAPSQYRERAIAERLLRELHEPKSWKFYLWSAYRLSEDTIWRLVEIAKGPKTKDTNRYFIWLVKKELGLLD